MHPLLYLAIGLLVATAACCYEDPEPSAYPLVTMVVIAWPFGLLMLFLAALAVAPVHLARKIRNR